MLPMRLTSNTCFSMILFTVEIVISWLSALKNMIFLDLADWSMRSVNASLLDMGFLKLFDSRDSIRLVRLMKSFWRIRFSFTIRKIWYKISVNISSNESNLSPCLIIISTILDCSIHRDLIPERGSQLTAFNNYKIILNNNIMRFIIIYIFVSVVQLSCTWFKITVKTIVRCSLRIRKYKRWSTKDCSLTWAPCTHLSPINTLVLTFIL